MGPMTELEEIVSEFMNEMAHLYWPLVERLMLQGMSYEDAGKMSALALKSFSKCIKAERVLH